jgi:hypothetical protein
MAMITRKIYKVSICTIGVKVSWKSSPYTCENPLTTSRTLKRSTLLFTVSLTVKTYLVEIVFILFRGRSSS